MPLTDHDIEYRFSPRRKSIGLMVNAEGKLIVMAPRAASRVDIARALERHRTWIQKKIAERRAGWDRIQPGDAYLLGKPYRLKIGNGQPGPVELGQEEIRVPLLPDSTPIWGRLQAWYQLQAEGFITQRVRHFATLMKLRVKPLEFREWKRRWGECHLDGKLKFNWRLIMLPPEVVDYVVVHELAHLIIPGHNPHFWRQVEAILPDYPSRRQWLNRYGGPFLLWRVPSGREK